jgi:glyoxylase-like metal-dependent hydrolase (beta-lactamase superfamily II)
MMRPAPHPMSLRSTEDWLPLDFAGFRTLLGLALPRLRRSVQSMVAQCKLLRLVSGVFWLTAATPRIESISGISSTISLRNEYVDTARVSRVLDSAAIAYGVSGTLDPIPAIRLAGSGWEWRGAEDQGQRPNGRDSTRHHETLAIDDAKQLLVFEYKTGRQDGSLRWRRSIFLGCENVEADIAVGIVTPRPMSTADSSRRQRLARRLPQVLVAEVRQHRENVTALRDTVIQGSAVTAITYLPPGETAPLVLLFSRRSGLLTRVGFRQEMPTKPNASIEFSYGYRREPGVGVVPRVMTVTVDGRLLRAVTYDSVSTNRPAVDSMGTLPDALQPFVDPPGTVVRVASGAYIIEQLAGYNLLFVEFRDFVLAVEAPAAFPLLDGIPAIGGAPRTSVSEAYIAKIRQTVGNKPIRYVVVSHLHSDHDGGIGAFIERGATVITSATDVPGMTALVGALVHTAGRSRMWPIEAVINRRTISDGSQVVQIVSIGRNPHMDAMLVVYLPKSGILFQGDLFYYDGARSFPPRGRERIMRFFAEWLKRHDLRPTRIYGVHGLGYATMGDVEFMLRYPVPDLPRL